MLRKNALHFSLRLSQKLIYFRTVANSNKLWWSCNADRYPSWEQTGGQPKAWSTPVEEKKIKIKKKKYSNNNKNAPPFWASDTDDFQTAFAHRISNSYSEISVLFSSEKEVTSSLPLINPISSFFTFLKLTQFVICLWTMKLPERETSPHFKLLLLF